MKLRLSVFALVVFVIFLLSWVIVANAQDGDPLPWEFIQDDLLGEETREYWIEWEGYLDEDTYLYIEFTVDSAKGSMAFEFEPSVQQMGRFAFDIGEVLATYATEGNKYIAWIRVTDLMLKDSESGELYPELRFDASAGPVTRIGVHVWDGNDTPNLVNFTVTNFQVVQGGKGESVIYQVIPL